MTERNPGIEIRGLWVRGTGGADRPAIEVLVEFNGAWHLVHTEPIQVGPVLTSHIWEPSGIASAPLDPLYGTDNPT